MSAEALSAAPAIRQTGALPGLIASARPRQWTKNLVLFGPLVFAYKLFEPLMVLHVIGAFVTFCLISSATYMLNDLLDVANDRLHPAKRFRPLASGQITQSQAVGAAIVLTLAALSLGFATDPSVGLAAAAYMVLMMGYSTVLKHLVIIDVFAIAAGFMLRAVTGAFAIHVVISPWLYVCTLLLALFLGFSKRYNELLVLQDTAGSHRRSLEDYTPQLLEQITSILMATVVMAYSLYTFSAESLPASHSMMLTIPFVLYGVFRYQYLVHRKNLGGAPEQVLLRDLPLMIDVALWGMTAILVLYLSK
jgi:4-hydroxybenzoate polyprenyltransferase